MRSDPPRTLLHAISSTGMCSHPPPIPRNPGSGSRAGCFLYTKFTLIDPYLHENVLIARFVALYKLGSAGTCSSTFGIEH